jgi:hypothetical protein
MGSKGGQTQTTKTEPWKYAQPYLRDSMEQAASLTSQPQQYYPGQTYVGALPSEMSAFAGRAGYDSQMYGAPLGQVMGGMSGSLAGQNSLGQITSSLAPTATQGINSAFAQGPGSVSAQGASSFAPQFGQAGSLDARGALQSALSGQPDYSGLQASIDAANAPMLRQLEQDIIPGLNQRATFLNNETGGIKALNRVLPEIGERMSQNATGLYNQERLRALDAQQNAAGLISQGGLSSFGLGLQGAGQDLQGQIANANLGSQFRGDLLGLGNLAGNLAGTQAQDAARWGALYPGLAQAGSTPYNNALQYGQFERGIAENALQGDMNRWNFQQQEPYDRLSFYNQMIQGTAGLGGTTRGTASTGSGISGTGALGGALTGAQLGSLIPGLGTGIGAGIGGLLGLFGG